MFNINPSGPGLPSGRAVSSRDAQIMWRQVPRRTPNSVFSDSDSSRGPSRATTTLVSGDGDGPSRSASTTLVSGESPVASPNYFAPIAPNDDDADFRDFDNFRSLDPYATFEANWGTNQPSTAAAAAAPHRPAPRRAPPQAALPPARQLRNRALDEPSMPPVPDFNALARARGYLPETTRAPPMTVADVVKDPRMIPGLDDTM
jgi:hypothetical protein